MRQGDGVGKGWLWDAIARPPRPGENCPPHKSATRRRIEVPAAVSSPQLCVPGCAAARPRHTRSHPPAAACLPARGPLLHPLYNSAGSAPAPPHARVRRSALSRTLGTNTAGSPPADSGGHQPNVGVQGTLGVRLRTGAKGAGAVCMCVGNRNRVRAGCSAAVASRDRRCRPSEGSRAQGARTRACPWSVWPRPECEGTHQKSTSQEPPEALGAVRGGGGAGGRVTRAGEGFGMGG
eukprot:scaffold10856_cov100-Isochrysis_galbana.AAC.2